MMMRSSVHCRNLRTTKEVIVLNIQMTVPTTKKIEKIVELHQLQFSYQVVDVQ